MTNKHFTVGDTVWFARCGQQSVTRPCPVCFGKRAVVVILGNGEHVQTPCDYCGKGYDGPRGTVDEYEWTSNPLLVTVARVETETSADSVKNRYFFGEGNYATEEDIFPDRESATLRCGVLCEEHQRDEAKRMACLKEYAKRNFSWHVGYHRKEVVRAKASIEYHTARAIACQAKAKTPVETAESKAASL